MKKNTIKTIMADNAVNTGRQPELDLVKAVFILLFPLIMIPQSLYDGGSLLYYFTNNIIDVFLVSSSLLFLIGTSISFYDNKSFFSMLDRSVRLLLAGIVLNFFAAVIPYIAAYFVTGDFIRFIEPLKMFALSNDVLTFASVSIFMMAIFIRFAVPDYLMLAISLVLSIAGSFLSGIDTGVSFLNIFLGYFIAVSDDAGNAISYYPFFNLFILVVAGYLFGKILGRVGNKKRFYKQITAPCLIAGLAYLIICIVCRVGLLRPGIRSYCDIQFYDFLFLIPLIIGVIGIAYYIDRAVSEKTRSLINRISRSITWNYAISSFVIRWFCIIAFALGVSEFFVTFAGLIIVSGILAVLIVSLSVFVKEHFSSLSGRIRHGKQSISKTFLVGLILFAFAVAIFSGYFVATEFWDDQIEHITNNALAINEMCADLIDPDKAVSYLDGCEPDEYYDMVKNCIDDVAGSSGIDYVYVIKADKNTNMFSYIWDSEGFPIGWSGPFEHDMEDAGIYDGRQTDILFYNYQNGYGNMATVCHALYSGAGDILLICTEVSVPDIMGSIMQFVQVILISVFATLIIAIGIFYFSIRKNIIDPIGTLNDAVNDTVNQLEENNSISIGISTGDEIEDLSHNYEKMFVSMKSYMRDLAAATAEKEHIDAELSIATDIQQAMLTKEFPDLPEFDLCAMMDPAKEIGGDFYDFYMIDDSHLAFVVADVSGKGVPAALFMVIAKTLLKDHTNNGNSLDVVFDKVNDILVESDERGMFVTAFEGVLDLKTGEIVFVNAGHEPPYIRTAEGYKPFKLMPGLVLSCMPGTKYKTGTLKLEEGDAIFQYTDGVTEATNSDNELYGFERLSAVLNANTDKSSKELLPAIKADIDRFVGEAPQFDDITMLCLEFKQKMKDK